MTKKVDLLIIGNGAAGNSAAFAARKADQNMSILIISKEMHTEYSAPALPDYLSGELLKEKLMVNIEKSYKDKKIQLHLNDPVTKVVPEEKIVQTASGCEFVYKNLIFATGGFPIQLRKMKGTDLPGNFVMKTIDDIEAMANYKGKRAVVVGSGAIGLEGSMALKARGYEKVTMVEALDWLNMKALDRETSDELTKSLNANGIEVLAGEAVQGVEADDCVRGVITSKRTIPCDLILWGIGVRPEVTLAKETGVELGELGGIKVDDHMRTSIPGIYACGDCTESTDRLTGKPALHLLWEPAQRGGIVAGENCAGLDKCYNGSYAIFLTHKGGLSITAFGKTEENLKDTNYKVLEEKRAERYRRLLFEAGKLVGVQMVNTMENVDLLFDQIGKNAVVRENIWDLSKSVTNFDGMTVIDYINGLKKERRTMVKR